MSETGGTGVKWRKVWKSRRIVRDGATPIGMGADTFLKISVVFVASKLDPNCQNSRIEVRVIPS